MPKTGGTTVVIPAPVRERLNRLRGARMATSGKQVTMVSLVLEAVEDLLTREKVRP